MSVVPLNVRILARGCILLFCWLGLGFFYIAEEAEHADCDSILSKIGSYDSVVRQKTRRMLLSLVIHTNLAYEL